MLSKTIGRLQLRRRGETSVKSLEKWYTKKYCTSRIKSSLGINRLRSEKGWAVLKAHGAATRYLVDYALALLSEFGDFDDERWGYHDQLATGVCQLQAHCKKVKTTKDNVLERMHTETADASQIPKLLKAMEEPRNKNSQLVEFATCFVSTSHSSSFDFR